MRWQGTAHRYPVKRGHRDGAHLRDGPLDRILGGTCALVRLRMVLTAGSQHRSRPRSRVEKGLRPVLHGSEAAWYGPMAGQQPRTTLGIEGAAWKRTLELGQHLRLAGPNVPLLECDPSLRVVEAFSTPFPQPTPPTQSAVALFLATMGQDAAGSARGPLREVLRVRVGTGSDLARDQQRALPWNTPFLVGCPPRVGPTHERWVGRKKVVSRRIVRKSHRRGGIAPHTRG